MRLEKFLTLPNTFILSSYAVVDVCGQNQESFCEHCENIIYRKRPI